MTLVPRTLTAAAGLAAVTLLGACSAGTAVAPSTAPLSTPGAAAATPTGAPTTTAPGLRRLAVTVSGDSVSGDTGTVDVTTGEPIELTVTSDVADEVHVHGVDVGKDVTAGGTVVIDFTQPAPGRFEVELEKAKRTLLRLQVS